MVWGSALVIGPPVVRAQSGFSAASAEVPALCGSQAGTLVNGELPDSLLATAPDLNPGMVRWVVESGQIDIDLGGDGTTEHVLDLACVEPFIGVPPAAERHLAVYADDGRLLGSVAANIGPIVIRADGPRVRVERTWCNDDIEICIPSGADAAALTMPHAGGAPVLERLPSAETFSDRELRAGDRGFEVVALQGELITRGASIEADGQFGPATVAALQDAQYLAALNPDGLAGPRTRAALGIGRSADTLFASEAEFVAALLEFLNGGDTAGLPGDAITSLEPWRLADDSPLVWDAGSQSSSSNGRVLVWFHLHAADAIADSMADVQVCVIAGPQPRWRGLWRAPFDSGAGD